MGTWLEDNRVDLGGIVQQLIDEGWIDKSTGTHPSFDPHQLNVGLIALQRHGNATHSPEVLNYDQLVQRLTDRILEAFQQYPRLIVEFIGLDVSGKEIMRKKVVEAIQNRGRPRPAYVDLSGYLLPREERARLEITPYHPQAFDARRAGEDIQTLLETGRAETPIYKNGRVVGTTVVEGDFAITDESWSLHPPPLDAPYLFFYVLARDALRLDRKLKRDRYRYDDRSFIYIDFLLKIWDFLKFFAPHVSKLTNIAVETSNVPTVSVYTLRDEVLLPQTMRDLYKL